MQGNEYQKLAMRTNDKMAHHRLSTELTGKLPLSPLAESNAKCSNINDIAGLLNGVLGLTGEAGEVADKVKKVLRDKNGEFFKDPSTREEIMKEIGDVLWYCATLANDLGYSLEEVAEANIKKLSSRKERGMLGGNGDNR